MAALSQLWRMVLLTSLTIKASPEVLHNFLWILASGYPDEENGVTDPILPNLSELNIELFHTETYDTLFEDLVDVLSARTSCFSSSLIPSLEHPTNQSSRHDTHASTKTYPVKTLNSLRITDHFVFHYCKKSRLEELVDHLYVRVDDGEMDGSTDTDSNTDSDVNRIDEGSLGSDMITDFDDAADHGSHIHVSDVGNNGV